MFKVGQLCEGVNFVNRPDRNNLECEIIGPLSVRKVVTRGERRTIMGYRVRWADGVVSAQTPFNLRPKRPPTEYKGEQQILSLFKVKPREVQDA